VSSDYGATGNEFSGKVEWVQLDAGLDDADHYISPEERLCVAMSASVSRASQLSMLTAREATTTMVVSDTKD
jgi:hypothetical protein